MHCLLCNEKYNYLSILCQHYVEKHEIDVNNYFFKDLLKSDTVIFIPNKCLRCEYYFINSRDKKNP